LKRLIVYSTFFLCLVTFSFADAEVDSFYPNSTSEPFDQDNQQHIGSELNSLPASIARYNAERHLPDAKPSDDYASYGGELCHLPGFRCIPVSQGVMWANLWSNEHLREIVMRLNRTNVALRYRKWIVVPDHLKNINYMSLSPLPDHVLQTGHRLLIIDLRVFAFGAYDPEGDLVYWGPATGGKMYCSDTQEDCRSVAGKFKIYRIQGENCMSSKYPIDRAGGAPMPYCMHYYKGYAIHGSTLSGFVNRSRGCIRLFYNDAKWLNKDFVKLGTEVIVKRQEASLANLSLTNLSLTKKPL